MLWLVLVPLLAAPIAPWLVRRLGGRAGWLLALVPATLAVRFAGWPLFGFGSRSSGPPPALIAASAVPGRSLPPEGDSPLPLAPRQV